MDQHNLAAISTVVLHLNNILVHLHQCNPLASSMVALHLQYVLGYDLFQPNPLVINMAALHLHAALELDHRYQPNLFLRHLLATSTAVPHLHSTRAPPPVQPSRRQHSPSQPTTTHPTSPNHTRVQQAQARPP
jgi:hypothetical protein